MANPIRLCISQHDHDFPGEQPTLFASETEGLVLSQEEAPRARLLLLVTTSASFQPGSADAEAALGSARALLGLSPGHSWAPSPLTLL